MKINYLIGALFLSPLFAFADNSTEGFIFSPLPKNKNTVVRHYSNEQKLPDLKQMSQRTVDFPTQIVRVRGNVAGLKLSCEEVEDEINKVFSKKFLPIYLPTTLMSVAGMIRIAQNNTR